MAQGIDEKAASGVAKKRVKTVASTSLRGALATKQSIAPRKERRWIASSLRFSQ
jgi:hypothetical protein